MGNMKHKQALHESILSTKNALYLIFKSTSTWTIDKKNNLPLLKPKDMQKAKGNKGIAVQAI